MVKFHKSGFTIEVSTVCLPHENYIDTVNEIIDILSCIDKDLRPEHNYPNLHELLKEMMPNTEQMKDYVKAALIVENN